MLLLTCCYVINNIIKVAGRYAGGRVMNGFLEFDRELNVKGNPCIAALRLLHFNFLSNLQEFDRIDNS